MLGFPCNDFGAQEPGTLDEIKSFCSTTYGASFELFDKVHATGSTTEPTPPSTNRAGRCCGVEFREVPGGQGRHRAGPLQEWCGS